jgi:hypothetical protein
MMARLRGQRNTTFGAQSRAIRPAHRCERKVQSDGIDDGLLEVDGVVDDVTDLVFVGGRLRRAVRIREEFRQSNLHTPADLGQATGTLTDRRPGHRPGDQHAFRHRLDPQIQFQRSAAFDRDHVQPDARRAGHGVAQGNHRARTPPEPRDVDRHRRGPVLLRRGAVLPSHSGNPTARAA